MSDERATAFKWTKLFLGAAMFGAILYVHIAVKELPEMVLLAPIAVMGVELRKGKSE